MKGKLVAITGANDGIGYATSKEMLKRDYHLVMFCRNLNKAEKAKKSLIQETGNSNIEIVLVDLSSFESIEKACAAFKKKFNHLDVLINNAGIMQWSHSLSENGIEMIMAVNHFGSFLMTYHLLPALKNAQQGRIVNLASRAHFDVRLNFDEINEKEYFNFRKQYKISKLANVLFTRKLSEKLTDTNITCNCLDPGLVKTSLGKKTNSHFFSWAWKLFTLTGISPEKGAETVIYLATSEKVKHTNGAYFENCKIATVSEVVNDMSQMNDLWDWTMEKANLISWEI